MLIDITPKQRNAGWMTMCPWWSYTHLLPWFNWWCIITWQGSHTLESELYKSKCNSIVLKTSWATSSLGRHDKRIDGGGNVLGYYHYWSQSRWMGGCIFELSLCVCLLQQTNLPTHYTISPLSMNALRLVRPAATLVRRPAGKWQRVNTRICI